MHLLSFARGGLLLLWLTASLPSAEAGLWVDSGLIYISSSDARGVDCSDGAIRACLFDFDASEPPSSWDIDLSQRIHRISVAVGSPSAPLPLLPDDSITMHAKDIQIYHSVFRIATETYNGIPQDRPNREQAGVAANETGFGLSYHGPHPIRPAAPPKNQSFGFRYSNESGELAYDRVGPFYASTGNPQTDGYPEQSTVVCYFAFGGPADSCERPLEDLATKLEESTPNARLGLEVGEITASTNGGRATSDASPMPSLVTPYRGGLEAPLHGAALQPRGGPLHHGAAFSRAMAELPPSRPVAQTPVKMVPRADATQKEGVSDSTVVLVALGTLIAAFFASLYSRFTSKDKLMVNAKRQQVLDIVRAHPGIGLGDLAEKLGVARNAATHHVTLLRKAGLLVGHRCGRTFRLYLPEMGTKAPPKLTPMQREVLREIAAVPEGLVREELHERCASIPRRTRNHVLRVLKDLGFVEEQQEPQGTTRYRANVVL